MPLFTVVMPVYNVESYIKKSVESICSQSFSDIELILVDDGSQDNSISNAIEVLDEASIEFKVISQENRGVSSARNAGITAANGEWIICVDPDDQLHKDTFESIHKLISLEKEIDVIFLKYRFATVENNTDKACKISSTYRLIDREHVASEFLHRKEKLIAPGTIVRKKHILAMNLYFNEKVRYSEDQLFVWRVIESSDKVAIFNDPMYYYLMRPQSTMHASCFPKIITGYEAFCGLQKENESGKNYFGRSGYYILARWILGVLHASAKYMSYESFINLAEHMEYKKNLKKIFNDSDLKATALAFIAFRFPFVFWKIFNKK